MFDDRSHLTILTVAEVAEFLRVSETTVWRWCNSGKLPAFRIGRSWRVRRSDLDALIHDVSKSDDAPTNEQGEQDASAE